MPDKNLKLNSLSRYVKQSPNFVLQEYGHCEVPAGCGGVVLRWRKPGEPISMVLHLFAGNSKVSRIALDGMEIGNRSRVPIRVGEHVVTLILQEAPSMHALFILAGKLDPQDVRILKLSTEIPLLSLTDGSWKYTMELQGDTAWEQPEFDDSSWKPMVKQSFEPLRSSYGGKVSDWTRTMTELGADGLGIDTGYSLLERMRAKRNQSASLPAVYVRKAFRVTQMETGE